MRDIIKYLLMIMSILPMIIITIILMTQSIKLAFIFFISVLLLTYVIIETITYILNWVKKV